MSSHWRQKIKGYIAHKWGLTSNLPANHPYKTGFPTEDTRTDDYWYAVALCLDPRESIKNTDIFDSKINDLNDKYSDVDFTDPKNKKQYDKYNKEAGKLWSDSYKEMAIKNIGKDPVTKGYEYIDELPYMHMYD